MKSCASAARAAASISASVADGLSVGDVRPHALGEEEALLEDDADLAAKRGDRHLAHVVPVDAHGARARLVEAGHEVGRGRLPAAARPDEGDRLARRDPQFEPVQHRLAVDVGESDVLEDDFALDRRQLDGTGGVDDRRWHVEQLEDPLDAGAGLLAYRQYPRQHAGGRHELGQVGGKSEEGPERDLVADRQVSAEREHSHLAETGHGLQQGLVPGLEAHGAHL